MENVSRNVEAQRPNGFEATAEVLKRCPLPGTRKLVLLRIAHHYPDPFPSVATLARYAAVTPKNARSALHQLEQDGWITTKLNAGPNRTNRYEIVWAKLGCTLPPPGGVAPATSADTLPPPGGGTLPPARGEQTQEPTLSSSLTRSRGTHEASSSNGNEGTRREKLASSPSRGRLFHAVRDDGREWDEERARTLTQRVVSSLIDTLERGQSSDRLDELFPRILSHNEWTRWMREVDVDPEPETRQEDEDVPAGRRPSPDSTAESNGGTGVREALGAVA